VAQLARRAGEAILEVYRGVDPGVTYKKDDSPLTAADLASHRVIVEGLEGLAPEIPVLSEEGAGRPYEERSAWGRFWLVDPLDGTKEFIKRNGEFTVNIALVENGAPVLGVVYAPVLDREYVGWVGRGAWRRDGAEERREIRATGTGHDELAVVASRSHAGEALTAFLGQLGDHRLVSMGSSLKLCLVADGTADVYPRLGPTMEWDTAAAHGVVAAAGGGVLDLAGRALGYNKENLLNPHFLVVGERQVPWQEALRAAGLAPVEEVSS
jgi:3'(2'), 5'-bisphosphate nucleotidase